MTQSAWLQGVFMRPNSLSMHAIRVLAYQVSEELGCYPCHCTHYL